MLFPSLRCCYIQTFPRSKGPQGSEGISLAGGLRQCPCPFGGRTYGCSLPLAAVEPSGAPAVFFSTSYWLRAIGSFPSLFSLPAKQAEGSWRGTSRTELLRGNRACLVRSRINTDLARLLAMPRAFPVRIRISSMIRATRITLINLHATCENG